MVCPMGYTAGDMPAEDIPHPLGAQSPTQEGEHNMSPDSANRRTDVMFYSNQNKNNYQMQLGEAPRISAYSN